ncbi:MAG: hypothetical protein WCF04_09860 [Candidatus Nanopelagicales bacterium]
MAGRRSNGEGSLRRMRSRDLYQYRWTEWVDGGSVRRSGVRQDEGRGGGRAPGGHHAGGRREGGCGLDGAAAGGRRPVAGPGAGGPTAGRLHDPPVCRVLRRHVLP